MKDRNGKILEKRDTVAINGDSGLWIVTGFDDGVDIENLKGQKLNRSPINVAKLSGATPHKDSI